MIRYMTAGESHGEACVAIVDGFPSGLSIDPEIINKELKRRMSGYGRGGRMLIESDRVQVISGTRKKISIGSPICLMVKNKDFSIDKLKNVTRARPGHADLPGALKYNVKDIRNILERASARETVGRVAVGAVAKMLLKEFGISVFSHVLSIGPVKAQVSALSYDRIKKLAAASDLACADKKAETMMKDEIDRAKSAGDTLGGVIEVVIRGVPPGLGSHTQWDKRFDALSARALMAIQAVKGVEVGGGFKTASLPGSRVHDEIIYKNRGFKHLSNNAGGFEGGMTNGEHIVIRIAMKPIATLMKPLNSIDIITKKSSKAAVERSDVTAVPACGVIAEAVLAVETADQMIMKFGGDSVAEMKRNFKGYVQQMRGF